LKKDSNPNVKIQIPKECQNPKTIAEENGVWEKHITAEYETDHKVVYLISVCALCYGV